MAPMWYKDEEDSFNKDALLHKLQSEVEGMITGLTDKQKQLFQEDKYVLVDTIILLENKLKEIRKVVKYQQNELELCKEEIEEERQARCAAEGAHIKAQEEIDGTEKPVKLEDNLSFDEKVLRAIGKYEEETIKEEGENGQL